MIQTLRTSSRGRSRRQRSLMHREGAETPVAIFSFSMAVVARRSSGKAPERWTRAGWPPGIPFAHVARLRNSQPAAARVTRPISAIGQNCGASCESPAPSRKTPRTIDQEIPHRIDQGEDLHPFRHVGDRGGEAREDDRRHHEQERAEKRLLLRHRQGGDHQPDAGDGDDEQQQGRDRAGQARRAAAHGTSSTAAAMMTDASITPIRSPGSPLPSRISICRSGVTSSWSKVPSLALARDRQADDQQRHHLGQQCDDARHDEPARIEGGL